MMRLYLRFYFALVASLFLFVLATRRCGISPAVQRSIRASL